MASEDTARTALQQRAESVAHDIEADHPGTDVAYDLYVRQFRDTLTGDVFFVGVIYMGDVYCDAFEWADGDWHQLRRDPFEVLDIIQQHHLGGDPCH